MGQMRFSNSVGRLHVLLYILYIFTCLAMWLGRYYVFYMCASFWGRPGRQCVALSTSEGLSAARQLGGRLPEHGGALVYP